MADDDAVKYYSGRSKAAVMMARAASKPFIRKIHFELASRYAALARELRMQSEDNAVIPIDLASHRHSLRSGRDSRHSLGKLNFDGRGKARYGAKIA